VFQSTLVASLIATRSAAYSAVNQPLTRRGIFDVLLHHIEMDKLATEEYLKSQPAEVPPRALRVAKTSTGDRGGWNERAL